MGAFSDIADELATNGSNVSSNTGGFGAIANELGMPKTKGKQAQKQAAPAIQPAQDAQGDQQRPQLPAVGTPNGIEPWYERAVGAVEAPVYAVTGTLGGMVGGAASTADNVVKHIGGLAALAGNALAGDKKGAEQWSNYVTQLPNFETAYNQGAQALTVQPKTQTGRRLVEDYVQPVAGELVKLAPLAEMQMLAGAARPVMRAAIDPARAALAQRSMGAAEAAFQGKQAPRIDPTMGNEPPATQAAQADVQMPFSARDAEPAIASKQDAIAGAPGGLPPEQIAKRSDILSRVMPGATIRKSVLNGDLNAAAGDFEMARLAKSDDAGAIALKNAIDSERAGVQKFAEDTVQKVGGAKGLDEQSLQTKGSALANPIDGAIKQFKQQTSDLYKAADEQAGGAPSTQLKSFNDILNTDHNFAGKAEKVQLRNGVQSYMKAMNMVDEDGAPLPITAKQAEGLRQYINSEYGPQTKGLIGKLVGSIDEDVAQAAGGKIYDDARAMFRQKKQLFDNPQGISKLFDFDPETPINRKTALEKIPDTFMNLPLEQQGHIVDVFSNKMPTPELQAMGADALETIRSHALERLQKAGSSTKGTWNQKAVIKEMNSNSGTYQLLFKDKPEILQRMQDMRDAGQMITAEDKSYGGAAVQERTLLRRGADKIADTVRASGPAAVAGAMIPATSGLSTLAMPAAIKLGEKLSSNAKNARSLRDAQGRLTKISEFPGVESK